MDYNKYKKIKERKELRERQRLKEIEIKARGNTSLTQEAIENMKKNGIGTRVSIEDGFLHVFIGDVEGALEDNEILSTKEDLEKEIEKEYREKPNGV